MSENNSSVEKTPRVHDKQQKVMMTTCNVACQQENHPLLGTVMTIVSENMEQILSRRMVEQCSWWPADQTCTAMCWNQTVRDLSTKPATSPAECRQ